MERGPDDEPWTAGVYRKMKDRDALMDETAALHGRACPGQVLGVRMAALGCAGWEQGQLEEEVSNNFWLTVPADVKLIFSTDYENKAKAAAAILGVNLDHVSTQAGHS